MEMDNSEFWLWRGNTWEPVTKDEYVRVERQAGFHNTMGQPNEPGTAAFGNGELIGTTLKRETETRPFITRGSIEAPQVTDFNDILVPEP